MSDHLFIRLRLLVGVLLLVIPVLACQFSFSTASITNAIMARDVTGDNFDPVDITDTYTTDQREFHAVVTVTNAPNDTVMKAVWIAVDVGSAAAPNTTIDETEVEVEGSRNVDFTLTPNDGLWPPGNYKVDMYLNGEFDRSLSFTVTSASEEATAAPTPTVEATATAKPTEAVQLSPIATAEASSPVATGADGIITGAVMAVDVTVLSSTPVGITDTFPPGQAVVHAIVTVSNAPGGTRVKAVWTAIDVGDAAPPDSELGEYETTTQGSQNVDFTFEAGGGFPPGTYKVDIYLNDSLERTLDFSVAEEGANIPAILIPTAVPVGNCPPLPSSTYQPSGFVRSIIMAQDTQGANYEPVNPGRIFAPDAVFHAVVDVENAPDNTEVTVRWFVQDVGSAEPCNVPIVDPFTLTTSGSRNLDFTLEPPSGAQWPLGWYRVEVYVNGGLDLDVTFSVE